MKKGLKITGISISVLIIAAIIFAKANHISPISMGFHDSYNCNSDNLAIGGFDVVSFHTSSQPVKGKDSFKTIWNEVDWVFSTQENLNLFKNNPIAYAPQFGGYCAFAVSTGFTANTHGENYTLKNDKLYLFSNPEVKVDFLANSNTLVEATKNWQH